MSRTLPPCHIDFHACNLNPPSSRDVQAISNYWLQTLTGVSLFCGSVLGLAAPGTSWYMGESPGASACLSPESLPARSRR